MGGAGKHLDRRASWLEGVEEDRVSEELDRRGILEALLFVAEEPLPLGRLQEILADEDPATTEASIRELALSLEEACHGLMVQEVAGGFRLATRPEANAWIQRLQQVKPTRLSRAALETLAIVAYKQPITKPEVEAVRGVAVDGVIRTLLERDLIRMLGRKAEAGRPIVYGTSQGFLEHFGLKELGDLPSLREIDELINASGAQAASPSAEASEGPAADPAAEPTTVPSPAQDGSGEAEGGQPD